MLDFCRFYGGSPELLLTVIDPKALGNDVNHLYPEKTARFIGIIGATITNGGENGISKKEKK